MGDPENRKQKKVRENEKKKVVADGGPRSYG